MSINGKFSYQEVKWQKSRSNADSYLRLKKLAISKGIMKFHESIKLITYHENNKQLQIWTYSSKLYPSTYEQKSYLKEKTTN